MYRFWRVSTLALLLLSAGCTGVNEHYAAPDTSAALTQEQRTCRLIGEMGGVMARNRDAGVPLVRVLANARRTTIGPGMYQGLEFAGSYVYDRPWLSPVQAQQQMERECLQATAS